MHGQSNATMMVSEVQSITNNRLLQMKQLNTENRAAKQKALLLIKISE